MLYIEQGKKTALFYLFQATGGSWRRQIPDSKRFCRELLGWVECNYSSWSVIPVCDPEEEDKRFAKIVQTITFR